MFRCAFQVCFEPGALKTILKQCAVPIIKKLRIAVNQRDRCGNTPLHYAVKYWPDDTVISLLILGANVGIENNEGETPLEDISTDLMQNNNWTGGSNVKQTLRILVLQQH